MKEKPLVSIIISVKNEGSWLRKTVNSLFQVKTTLPFEVIVVDNHSDDGCCDFLSSCNNPQLMLRTEKKIGIANARNAGASMAKGDYLIFCDAHLIFEDNWIEELIAPIQQGQAAATNPCIVDVQNPKRMGFGYTWGENLTIRWNPGQPFPFPSPFLAGGCLAISSEVFAKISGFDPCFQGWGYDDQEISLKLWLFGYQCLIQPKVKIRHYFRNSPPPYPVRIENLYFNLLRMAYLHFKEERIDQCKTLIKNTDLNKLEQRVFASNVWETRMKYQLLRKYDDDWFMQKFNIPF